MEIRAALPRDFAAIVQLLPNQAELLRVYPKGRHPFTVAQLYELAEARKELTVINQHGEINGFPRLYGLAPQQRVFIGNVLIAPAHRRQGFGRKLVAHMLHLGFVKHGLPEVRISVVNENTPALLLYTGLGFEPYAIKPWQDPRGTRLAYVHMKLQREKAQI